MSLYLPDDVDQALLLRERLKELDEYEDLICGFCCRYPCSCDDAWEAYKERDLWDDED